jgi:hypothetical protein
LQMSAFDQSGHQVVFSPFQSARLTLYDDLS